MFSYSPHFWCSGVFLWPLWASTIAQTPHSLLCECLVRYPQPRKLRSAHMRNSSRRKLWQRSRGSRKSDGKTMEKKSRLQRSNATPNVYQQYTRRDKYYRAQLHIPRSLCFILVCYECDDRSPSSMLCLIVMVVAIWACRCVSHEEITDSVGESVAPKGENGEEDCSDTCQYIVMSKLD